MTSDRPNVWTRLNATLRGEVSATTLEAYRRAGLAVYTDLGAAETLRAELGMADGVWGASPAQQAQFLCTWNAFVAQVIAEAMLDADYAADPRTVGYVPPVTAQQAGALFAQVEPWLSRARQAGANPAYNLAAEIALPADLPDWVDVEPCPPAHLTAMLAAGRKVDEHADAALADAQKGCNDALQRDLDRMRQLHAEAHTALEYAAALYQPGASKQVHEAIEEALHRALEAQFHLGQLAAMPSLLVTYNRRQPAALPDPSSLPGGPRFDPWCLTDPATRDRWQRDPKARRAIDALWAYDPNPVATLTVQGQIDHALAMGDIAYATDAQGQRIGNFYCCPWPAIYEVRRAVRIGGRRLGTLEQFTFEVSAEEMAEGGEFERRILTGPFQPTNQIDYCDPRAGGH